MQVTTDEVVGFHGCQVGKQGPPRPDGTQAVCVLWAEWVIRGMMFGSPKKNVINNHDNQHLLSDMY